MTQETRPAGRGERLLQYLGLGVVAPVILVLLGSVFFTLVGALHGDTRAHVASGSPALEARLPWWRQGMHLLTSHFFLLLAISVGIAAATALLQAPRLGRDNSELSK